MWHEIQMTTMTSCFHDLPSLCNVLVHPVQEFSFLEAHFMHTGPSSTINYFLCSTATYSYTLLPPSWDYLVKCLPSSCLLLSMKNQNSDSVLLTFYTKTTSFTRKCSPKQFWQCLEAILNSTNRGNYQNWREAKNASISMSRNDWTFYMPTTGPHNQEVMSPKMSIMPSLRNPVLKSETASNKRELMKYVWYGWAVQEWEINTMNPWGCGFNVWLYSDSYRPIFQNHLFYLFKTNKIMPRANS